MFKKILIITLLLCFSSGLVLGQTADDIYERAAQKYLTGDLSGAESDLLRVLELSPRYEKAQELLNEVRKELGRTRPAAPATPAPPAPSVPETVRPQPKPAPVVPRTRPRQPKTPPPVFIPQRIPEANPIPPGLIQQLFFWLIVVSLLIVSLLVRIVYVFSKEVLARGKLQVCTECKWANPTEAEFCAKCGARLKPWTGVTAAQKKWYAKFGWARNPFTLDIMPKLFTGYQTQVQTILEKVYSKAGHVLVTGNKGVGKTTLLKWMNDKLKNDFHTIYIPRPTDNFDDLMEYLGESLKIKKEKGHKYTIYDLDAMASASNKNILLLLDEAHEFNPDFEKPLRSLGDLNGVKFVLAGLMETREKIKTMSPPFFDRIVLEQVLEHLSGEETRDLIKKRLEDVGGSGIAPFTYEAIENLYKLSRGIPRMILKVSDAVVTDAIRHDLNVISTIPEEVVKEKGSPSA